MTRKLLVRIIASFYIAQGLWDIGTFVLPIFTSPKYLTLNLFTILAGALGLWAGIYLFKLDEHGRKFTIGLLFLRIMYNLFHMIWVFFQKDLSFAVTYFGKPLFEPKGVYPFVIFLAVWVGIALGAIWFLMQRETKAIFVSATASEEGSKPIAKSTPNQ